MIDKRNEFLVEQMAFMCADKILGETLLIPHNCGYLEAAVIIVENMAGSANTNQNKNWAQLTTALISMSAIYLDDLLIPIICVWLENFDA